MIFYSHNVAAIVLSTLREAPGTLQKEWSDLLEVAPNGDHFVFLNKCL